MRLPLILIKTLVIWFAVSIFPATVAALFFGHIGAIAAAGCIGLILFGFSIFAEHFLRKTLSPVLMQIGPYRVLAIEDPSSHAFATQGLFSSESSLWITRGALSLLTPEEITNLIAGMRIASKQGALRFETVITAWLVRMARNIPSGFKEIIFFRQKRSKKILIRESARGVFWTSLVLLLEYFYFSRSTGPSHVTEEVLRKLEAESRRCVPRLPAALSSHSAVSPWPDAFLTLGRACLLPKRAVNFEV